MSYFIKVFIIISLFFSILSRRNNRYHNPAIELFYWKDVHHRKVDFLIKENTTITELIQVCWDVSEERLFPAQTHLSDQVLTCTPNISHTSNTSYKGLVGANYTSANSSSFNVNSNNSNLHIDLFNANSSDKYIMGESTQYGIPTDIDNLTIGQTITGYSESFGKFAQYFYNEGYNTNTSLQTVTQFNTDTISSYTSLALDFTIKSGYENSSYSNSIVQAADPVDMRTGEFFAEQTDIVIPVLLPIVVKRTYSSQQETFDFIGYGWMLNLNYFLCCNDKALAFEDDNANNNPPNKEGLIFRLSEDDGSVIEYNYVSSNSDNTKYEASA